MASFSSIGLLWHYFSSIFPKRRIALVLFILILSKILGTTAPLFFRWGLNSLEQEFLKASLMGIIGYVLFRFSSGFFNELRDLLFLPMEQKVLRSLSENLFSHLQNLPFSYHVDRKTGSLFHVIERGTKSVEAFFRFLVFGLLTTFFDMIIVCGLLLYFYPTHLGIALGCMFVSYCVFSFVVSKARLKSFQNMNKIDNNFYKNSFDSLINYFTIKYFSGEAQELKRYDTHLDDYYRVNTKIRKGLCFLNIGQNIILSVGLFFILILSCLDVQKGHLSIPDVVLLNVYVLQFIMPLHILGFSYREIRQSWIHMKEMFSIFQLPQECDDETSANPLAFKGGRIVFQSVTFGYQPEKLVLKECSFTIDPGQRVAFVRSSGAGKTSILNLLLRFLDPQQGDIFLDGQNLRHIQRASLRQIMGVIPQDILMFNESILYNITYGLESVSLDQVTEAAHQAAIHDFILSLPKGYHTIVGERGIKLSGGEKQRLAIARALLRKPKIFLFDEATSALDTLTEREIQKNFLKVTSHTTTLIIAHRLSTIVDVDCIFVLDEGCVLECGRHSDLLKRNGLYASLWSQQQMQSDLERPVDIQ